MRFIVVDDHPAARRALARLIGSQPRWEVEGTARNASDALELVRESSPDVVVVDLLLGDESGMALAVRILELEPSSNVVICSMVEPGRYASAAAEAGVSACIDKAAPTARLIETLRNACRSAS